LTHPDSSLTAVIIDMPLPIFRLATAVGGSKAGLIVASPTARRICRFKRRTGGCLALLLRLSVKRLAPG
jgi:hypothetical protein